MFPVGSASNSTDESTESSEGMSLLSPELDPHNHEMSTQGSTLSDTVIGVKSQPSSESDEEGSYEVDDENKEEDETPVPEEFENEPSLDEAHESPTGPTSPTITFSVDNEKSPTAQFLRQPSDSGGSPSSNQKQGKVPALRPISPIPGPPPGITFQPIKIVSASPSPTSNANLTASPPPTSEVSPVKVSSPRMSLQQPANPARASSPAMIGSGYYLNYSADVQPTGGMQQRPYHPAGGYISTAPSLGPGQPPAYSEAVGSGFLGGATSPYRSPSPIPNYGQQGVYQPNTMYPPVSTYNFPVSSTSSPIQMPTPSSVPSVPRNTPVSGFQRPPADGLDLEELRQALQNDLDPSEHGNRVRVNSSGHSTPSQGSHTMGSGSGFSSQSSSGAASPFPDRKASWPVSGPRSHNPPYPMNRSVSSPERKYSGERESPLSRRRELGPFK